VGDTLNRNVIQLPKVRAFNDFTLFSGTAVSSLTASAQLQLGWQLVNYAVLPLILLAVLANAWLWTSKRNLLIAADR
jgi:hypothetical protein